MRWKSTLPIALACGAIGLPGQPVARAQQALSAPDPAASTPQSRLRADVEFLADDLTEGRATGTRGYDIAARYVASRFDAIGLQPGTPDGWFQRIVFSKATARKAADTGVTIGSKWFQDGVDVALAPSFTDAQIDVTGDAVFVGYGFDAPAAGYDDYAGLNVRGKIVVMLSGAPAGAPSELGAHLSANKARLAEARGAIAVLTVPDPVLSQRSPWPAARKAAATAYTWNAPDGTAFRKTPRLKATGLLGEPAAKALFDGASASIEQIIAQAEQGKRPKGFALKRPVTIRQSSAVERIDSANVVAILPGADPLLSREAIVMTAHLDHSGIDPDAPGGDHILNGAMDNAGGIAVLLEAARTFTTGATRPKRTIVFAAVTAEERGLLGSQYLARHPLVADTKVVAAINIDNSVFSYDLVDVTAYGAKHSTIGDAVTRATQAVGVHSAPDPIPELTVFVRSDHYSFVQEGVPSIFLLTGYGGEGAAAWAAYWKDRYHKPADDLGQPFNWASAAKFARLNYLLARDLADAPAAPRWYQGDFFGDTFAAQAPKAPRPR